MVVESSWAHHKDPDQNKSIDQRWVWNIVLILARDIQIQANRRRHQYHLRRCTDSAFAVRCRILGHRRSCSCGSWSSEFLCHLHRPYEVLNHRLVRLHIYLESSQVMSIPMVISSEWQYNSSFLHVFLVYRRCDFLTKSWVKIRMLCSPLGACRCSGTCCAYVIGCCFLSFSGCPVWFVWESVCMSRGGRGEVAGTLELSLVHMAGIVECYRQIYSMVGPRKIQKVLFRWCKFFSAVLKSRGSVETEKNRGWGGRSGL